MVLEYLVVGVLTSILVAWRNGREWFKDGETEDYPERYGITAILGVLSALAWPIALPVTLMVYAMDYSRKAHSDDMKGRY